MSQTVLGCALGALSAACDDGTTSPPGDVPVDAGDRPDGAVPDASGPVLDAQADATGDGGCLPPAIEGDCEVPANSALPGALSCTGLYADPTTRELACGVLSYTPAFELWSDDTEKLRYVWLPEGSSLDARDPNEIVYPVGTKFWKEFRAATSGRLLETRLLQKIEAGWVFTSYVWNAAGTEAVQNNDGVFDLHGTGHTVPNRDQCDECHMGRADKVLGWDAFMLGQGASGLTWAELARLGLLGAGSVPTALEIPGDDVERTALGYLHANCGISCHNDGALAKARDTGLMLRLEASAIDRAVDTHAVTTSLYRVPGTNTKYDGLPLPDGADPREYYRDVIPGDLARSLLLVRMEARGVEGQMPPIGSNRVDEAGVNAIGAWIRQMTPERGYPQEDSARVETRPRARERR